MILLVTQMKEYGKLRNDCYCFGCVGFPRKVYGGLVGFSHLDLVFLNHLNPHILPACGILA